MLFRFWIVGPVVFLALIGAIAFWWLRPKAEAVLTKVALFFPIPKGAEPHISLMTAGVAVSLLVVVGLIVGVGPARRAAAVYPVEALRAE